MEHLYLYNSCIRGHHIYKKVWSPSINEELTCVVEKGNAHDPYAVAVTKGELIVGHLPCKIPAACSLFLHRNGLITARVTDTRQYSIDLPQGGLEVPCVLKFVGEVSYVEKVKKLLPHPSTSKAQMHGEIEQASKKRKVSVVEIDDASGSHEDFWVRFDSLILTAVDRKIVAEGKELSDKHMNFAQSLMKQQFADTPVKGFVSTVIFSNK